MANPAKAEAGHDATVATTEAGHEAAAAAHAAPSVFGMDATAWVSLAMLVFIAIIIWKKAPAAITGGLDRKIAAIRHQLDEATQLRAEAEALRGKYEAQLKNAETEAANIKAAAEREAAELIEKAKVDTNALIARRQKMAEDKIAAAERNAVAELRAKAASAAAKAAEVLIAEGHDAAADRKLVDQSIGALGKLH